MADLHPATTHHLSLAVRGRRALARDETQRRSLMRSVVATGRERLLLPCLVDDHLHGLARTHQPGYLARDLRRVIRTQRPDLELKQAHLEPVGTRAYLRWLVTYLLTQPIKHGLPGHPALWTGSCFQDLVGARLLDGFDPSGLLDELPRFRLREAYEIVGLNAVELAPATDEELRRAGASRLVDLAAGVFAVGPEMRGAGRSKRVVEARVLAAHAGRVVGLPPGETARFLGVGTRTVHSLAKRPPPDRGMVALRKRLALEVRAQSSLVPTSTRTMSKIG
jgi:REP element-mobilizing transposase RayT